MFKKHKSEQQQRAERAVRTLNEGIQEIIDLRAHIATLDDPVKKAKRLVLCERKIRLLMRKGYQIQSEKWGGLSKGTRYGVAGASIGAILGACALVLSGGSMIVPGSMIMMMGGILPTIAQERERRRIKSHEIPAFCIEVDKRLDGIAQQVSIEQKELALKYASIFLKSKSAAFFLRYLNGLQGEFNKRALADVQHVLAREIDKSSYKNNL